MLIFGINPVRESIRSQPSRVRWVAVGRGSRGRIQALVEEARAAGVDVRFVTPPQLDRLATGAVHNGVVAEVSEGGYAEFESLFEGDGDLVVLLDGVQDPQNLGAILRSADGFGASMVVIPKHGSVGLTGSAVKASAGASEWVPVAQVTNMSRAIETLKAHRFWVYAADMDGEPIDSIDFADRVAIVLGSEGSGVRRNVLEHCDVRVSIPLSGRVESLNVSVAAGVILHAVRRGRTR